MERGPIILSKSALHSFTWDGKWPLFTKSALEYAYLYQRSIHRRVRMEVWGVWIIIRVIVSVPFTNRQALTVAKCMAGNQVIVHAQEGLSFTGYEHLGCCCCTFRLYFPASPAMPRAQRYNVMSCFHLCPLTQQQTARCMRTSFVCCWCCVINKWDFMACSRNRTHKLL